MGKWGRWTGNLKIPRSVFSICTSPTWFSTGKGQSWTFQTEDSLNVIPDGDRKRGEKKVFYLPDRHDEEDSLKCLLFYQSKTTVLLSSFLNASVFSISLVSSRFPVLDKQVFILSSFSWRKTFRQLLHPLGRQQGHNKVCNLMRFPFRGRGLKNQWQCYILQSGDWDLQKDNAGDW